MEQCKTCKYYPESEYTQDDIKELCIDDSMRICQNAEVGDGKIEIQGYGEIKLRVSPDFGCILYEER